MKALAKTRFIFLFYLLYAVSVNAQNAKQTVNDAVNSINWKVESLHQLAAQKKIYNAVDKLDEINKEINKEITWGTFDEKYKEAKMADPGFTFNIKSDLPRELNPQFWADYELRCDRIMSNQKVSIDGIAAMVKLNKFDRAMAYSAQLKTTYETFQNAAENLGTANLPKFAYDLYGNMNDFIENYKKIEEAELEGINIRVFEVEFNRMTSRARHSQDLYNEYKRYIKSSSIVINDFDANIKYINKLKTNAASGPLAKLSYADDKYNWNYGPFQKEVKESAFDFENYDVKCEAYKSDFVKIKQSARNDWKRVQENIFASDDAEKKSEFLTYHDGRWTEFLDVVNPVFNKTFNQFCTGNQETKSKNPDPKKEPEIIVVSDPFEGSSSKGNAEPSKDQEEQVKNYPPEKQPEPRKTPPSKSPPANYKSSDKYWENSIPENAEREWIKVRSGAMTEYVVRYKVNGRTVGYRKFKDHTFKLPREEDIRDNLAVKHGPTRKFSNSSGAKGAMFLSELIFYRANKKTGPSARFNKDGFDRVKYFIDDVELSQTEYRQKAQADKSLAPYDIYTLSKWKEIPSEKSMPDPPEVTNSDKVDFNHLQIPSDAIKYIKVSPLNNRNGISYSEYYYLPNNTFEEVGERTWFIYGNDVVLRSEEIHIGRKGIERSWNAQTGELQYLDFKNRDNIFEGLSTYDNSCGPEFSKGEITYKKYNGANCTQAEYMVEKGKYPQLPSTEISNSLKLPGSIGPKNYSDPEWVNQNVTSMGIPSGAKAWQIQIYDERVSVSYFINHSEVAEFIWHDRKMTQPSQKQLKSHNKVILSASWYKNGNPKTAHITGRIQREGIYCNFNENGTVKSYTISGRSGSTLESTKQAYQTFSNIPPFNSHLSSSLKSGIHPPKIPQSEKTPVFLAVWGKDAGAFETTPSYDPVVNSETQDNNSGDSEVDNYEQLQKQEFWTLMEPINQKIDAATKSFDKPYWEESQGPRATDNPKQKSLDLMRQAVQIAKKAKYPENEGALNYFIAYKLINFSGRVFAYQSKEAFFLLAAKLIVRSDQLLTANRYMKEDLSEAYCMSAEIWREMTRKALWGDHAYNKTACDKMVIRQYERAIRADPNNLKAKRILEQLKAPKKPVPSAADNFEEIKPQAWNDAQTIMAQLEDDNLEIENEQENFSEVAAMTLEASNGTVSVKRAGAANWEKVTDTHIVIFEGDKIKTSENATGVSITYSADNTFFAIKPGSEVEIYSNKLLIRRGSNYFDVTKKGTEFMVITPTCAVGVRGTRFEVSVAADKTTDTYLFEGVVETRNGSEIAYLVPGQKMTAKTGESKLEQSSFDVYNRKAKNWTNIDNQRRRHEQIKVHAPVGKNSGKGPAPSHTPKTNPTTNSNSPSPSEIWSIETYSDNMQNFEHQITATSEKGFVPVGLNCTNNQFNVLYLGGEVLNISAWNMEWYNDANSLQQGITKNMNEGYIPTGFSWSGSAYYVFYVMTDFTGQSWQIISAPQDLTAVSNAIQPYVEDNYVPMGITLFGDEYYTLLVQFVEPLADKWFIEGYQDNAREIANGINSKIPEAAVPWGMLKSSGVANILYIGF